MVRSSLSVLLANYNDSQSIGEAIEAICTQSRPPDEFIIIDDGSTDDSVEVIQQYARRFAIIKLVRREKNLGVVHTINEGLDLAQCEYIYFASANDRILPGFLEKSMALLERNSQAQMCCTQGKAIYVATGEPVPDARQRWSDEPTFLSGQAIAELLDGHSMYGGSYITRRACMMEMGRYCPELKWHCDYFLHHMIALRFGTCYIPEALVLWRYDPAGGYSSGMRNHALQRQVFLESLRLLMTAENSDIINRVVRARLLELFLPVLSVPTLLAATFGPVECPRSAVLLRHLWSSVAKHAFKTAKERIGWQAHVAIGIVRNMCDQIYAHVVDRYVRLRRLLWRRTTGNQSNQP